MKNTRKTPFDQPVAVAHQSANEPTANNDMAIAQDEIFGPVGCIIGFDTDEEAVQIANDSRYGLAGCIETADAATGYAMALKIRTGSVALNGGTGTMPRHYFLDLATWHRINFLYTQRTTADLKALRHEADRPELIDRLAKVIAGRKGHAVAMEVEAAKIARDNPSRKVVFLAAGFETTTAPSAALLAQGAPANLLFLMSGRRTWPAVARTATWATR